MSSPDAGTRPERSARTLGYLDAELPDELFEDLPPEELEAWEVDDDR